MNDSRITMDERIKASGLKLSKAESWHENPNMVDSENMDHWKLTLANGRKRMTVYFSMGYGHGGKQPRLAEVLNALAADASSVDNTNGFEDFASELGYDADSRKAERIYRVCVRQAGKFKNFIGETLYGLLLWDTDQD